MGTTTCFFADLPNKAIRSGQDHWLAAPDLLCWLTWYTLWMPVSIMSWMIKIPGIQAPRLTVSLISSQVIGGRAGRLGTGWNRLNSTPWRSVCSQQVSFTSNHVNQLNQLLKSGQVYQRWYQRQSFDWEGCEARGCCKDCDVPVNGNMWPHLEFLHPPCPFVSPRGDLWERYWWMNICPTIFLQGIHGPSCFYPWKKNQAHCRPVWGYLGGQLANMGPLSGQLVNKKVMPWWWTGSCFCSTLTSHYR